MLRYINKNKIFVPTDCCTAIQKLGRDFYFLSVGFSKSKTKRPLKKAMKSLRIRSFKVQKSCIDYANSTKNVLCFLKAFYILLSVKTRKNSKFENFFFISEKSFECIKCQKTTFRVVGWKQSYFRKCPSRCSKRSWRCYNRWEKSIP